MAGPPPFPAGGPYPADRQRSVGLIEREGEAWSCVLVTYRESPVRWRGYLAFRPTDPASDRPEVRTASIFLESSQSEIERKARGLGRPLLGGLLSSALHARRAPEGDDSGLRRWFHDLLTRNAATLSAEPSELRPDVERLRSLYDSYRLDQVAHFISLVEAESFRGAVEMILDGRRIDFGARDRLQFAMFVVEFIETHLPLPPFEVWAKDYLEHRDEYRRYAHVLHRGGQLP